MKMKDVVIGETYMVKVSGNVVPVRILRERAERFCGTRGYAHGGWDAINTVTNRAVHVRTAARLRRAVREDRVSEVRRKISEGNYFTPEKIDRALDRALDEVLAGGANA